MADRQHGAAPAKVGRMRTDERRLPRVTTSASAVAAGVSRRTCTRRVADGDWLRLLPGIYRTGRDLAPADRLDAALLFGGPRSLLSGAAALWAGGARIGFPATVLVLVPPTVRRESAEFVLLRPSRRPARRSPAPGRRRVEIARAVADHALTLRRLDDVRALVARAVRDHGCSLDDLARELAAGPRNGSALLRRALAEVGSGAASAPEARAARLLRAGRVPHFEQNARIVRPGGGHYVVDFWWPLLRAVLEIDSVEYHLDPADWRRTMDRHRALSALGLSVIHQPPSALAAPNRFLEDVWAWLLGCAAAAGILLHRP
jgi:very-short-patch-repair endonuclease